MKLTQCLGCGKKARYLVRDFHEMKKTRCEHCISGDAEFFIEYMEFQRWAWHGRRWSQIPALYSRLAPFYITQLGGFRGRLRALHEAWKQPFARNWSHHIRVMRSRRKMRKLRRVS